MSKTNPDWLQEGEGHADITLSRPLALGAAKTTTIRMREPTVADQLAIDSIKGGDTQKEIGFFANLCELAPADIQKLTLRDYKRLQTALGLFID